MAALKFITLLVYPRFTASSDLLSRYVLHLGYNLLSEMVLELMPCALAPAYGVASMPIHPGCHRPFHHSVVLRSYAPAVIVVACFLFVWISSFASATLSTLCFSMSSRQPSSLSGPSPCLFTAGAYCCSGRYGIRTRLCFCSHLDSGFHLASLQGRFLLSANLPCFVYCVTILS